MRKLLSLTAAAQALAVGSYSFDDRSLFVSKQGGIPYPVQLSTGKCRKKKSNGIHRSRMLKRKHRKP